MCGYTVYFTVAYVANWYNQNRIIMVPTNKLRPNPLDEFSDPKIGPSPERLSYHRNYILQHGTVEEPLEVLDMGNYYEISGGHHRWLAAQQAGLEKVPVKILPQSE